MVFGQCAGPNLVRTTDGARLVSEAIRVEVLQDGEGYKHLIGNLPR